MDEEPSRPTWKTLQAGVTVRAKAWRWESSGKFGRHVCESAQGLGPSSKVETRSQKKWRAREPAASCTRWTHSRRAGPGDTAPRLPPSWAALPFFPNPFPETLPGETDRDNTGREEEDWGGFKVLQDKQRSRKH